METKMIKNEMPTAIDLFCGAGGMSLGFEKAGFQVVYAIDHHPDPLKTYENNRRDLKYKFKTLLSDIKDIKGKNILNDISINSKFAPKIDVIFGGPPCQGFSLRGKRNKDDPRNFLVYEYIRMVQEINPECLVFENVPGLLTNNNRDFLDEIIRRLRKLGYHISFDILNAADFGVPQNRKRFFIIGSRNSDSIYFPKRGAKSKKIKALYDYYEINPPKSNGLPILEKKISTKEALDDIALNNIEKTPIKHIKKPNGEFLKKIRAPHNKLFNHITTKHRQTTIERFSKFKPGYTMKDIPKEYRTNRTSVQRMFPHQPSRTITSCNEDFIHYSIDRIITIREMARLQSFPDSYVFFGTPTTGGNRRKISCCQVQQVGNSVPPLLAQVIAEGLLKMLGYKSNKEIASFLNALNKRDHNPHSD